MASTSNDSDFNGFTLGIQNVKQNNLSLNKSNIDVNEFLLDKEDFASESDEDVNTESMIATCSKITPSTTIQVFTEQTGP